MKLNEALALSRCGVAEAIDAPFLGVTRACLVEGEIMFNKNPYGRMEHVDLTALASDPDLRDFLLTLRWQPLEPKTVVEALADVLSS